jgi:Domain of unknown function (DUF5664)
MPRQSPGIKEAKRKFRATVKPLLAKEIKLKDSGKRQDFGTGSVRDLGDGKGSYELLQHFGVHALAMQLERGAKKYASRNWEKGQPCGRYFQSAFRHISYYNMGLRDEPHLSAAIWNLACLIDTIARIEIGLLPAELNDMPKALTEKQQNKLLAYLKKI